MRWLIRLEEHSRTEPEKGRAENTNLRRSITVWLTSCLTGLASTKQVKLIQIAVRQSS